MLNLTPSSFNKKEYDKLKLIIGIKRKMLQLTTENVHQTGEEILSNKEIVCVKEGVLVLCRCFIDVASFYPKNLNLLIELFIFLYENKSPESNLLDYLPDFIVTCIHTRENLRSSALFFLRKLYLQKVISLNLIIDEINILPPHFDKIPRDDDSNQGYVKNTQSEVFTENENVEGKLVDYITPYSCANRKKIKVILWFYPEIIQRNKKFSIEHFVQVPRSEFKYGFKPLEFIENINNGFCPDPLARMIRKDDVDSFSVVFSQVVQCNFDGSFEKTASFERYSILAHQPTYIQYATYFDSIKIFKYLFLNKAEMSTLKDNIYSLIQIAVVGGSIEIIHILEQNHFKMFNCIPIAIESYQNEILEYILDNYFPNSENDFIEIDFANKRQREINTLRSAQTFSFDFDEYNDFDIFYKNYDSYYIQPFQDEDDVFEYSNDDDDQFKFFNFDIVFRSIVESNNLLALFILFNHGMNINSQDQQSKRTLLHFAVQKGKTFLVQLLLSNKFIDPTLKDIKGESPIVYSVKFGKSDLFFQLIKNEKISKSLDHSEYIKLARYADLCELKNVTKYLMKNWNFDLVNMIEIDDIKNFANIVYAAPLFYFDNQFLRSVDKAFVDGKYHYLSMLLNRNLIPINFYYKYSKDLYNHDLNPPNILDLLEYYRFDPKGRTFYQLYKRHPNPYKQYYIHHDCGFDRTFDEHSCIFDDYYDDDHDEYCFMFYSTRKSPYIEKRDKKYFYKFK